MAYDVVAGLFPFMHWIRTHYSTFHIDDLLKELEVAPTKENVAFLKRVIEYNHIAYGDDVKYPNSWFARNLIIEEMPFSITPTELEIEQKIIIQGSRFDPYMSNLANAMIPKMEYNGEIIESSFIALPLSKIKEYYYLYSIDDLMEHLNSIEANDHHQFIREAEDNDYFYVPCFDMEKCYANNKISPNTKLVFQVNDFEHKIIVFVKATEKKGTKKVIKEWEHEFKKFFFSVARTHQIDCTTIADLIAHAIFLGMDNTFGKECWISPQEYLFQHNLLQDVRIGVKDVRWIKDEAFSPYDLWFHHVLNFRYLVFRENKDENFFASIYSPLTEGMTYFFILEFAERNYLKLSENYDECKEECVRDFIHDFFNLETYQPYHKKIASIIRRKYKKYALDYNPFNKTAAVDLAIGMLRVFKRVVFAVSHLQRRGIGPQDIPHDISIVVQQMSQDIDYATKNILNLMKNKNLPDHDKSIVAIRDLTDKFEVIVNEAEMFVFSRYGRP